MTEGARVIVNNICYGGVIGVFLQSMLQRSKYKKPPNGWLFAQYGLQMTFEQYVLVGSTVRSFLVWLKETGKMTARFENNLLLWQSSESIAPHA